MFFFIWNGYDAISSIITVIFVFVILNALGSLWPGYRAAKLYGPSMVVLAVLTGVLYVDGYR